MKRIMLDPYWGNQEKTQVICKFKFANGLVQTASVMKSVQGNSDWKELFDVYTIEQIDKNTEEELKKDNLRRQKTREAEKEQVERVKADELFALKLEAFEIEEVKKSKNRELKSKIRKAKNSFEVTAYAAALMLKENE